MNWNLVAVYLVTLSVAMIVPGPDMLYVLAAGMRGGPRAGLVATCGVATSETVHIGLAAAGLSALFAEAPTALTIVRIVGGGYLVVLGCRAFSGRATLGVREALAEPTRGHRTYLRGLLTNLLNPKMITFTISFLPQFVDRGRGRIALQFAVLGAMFIALEFIVDGSVGLLAGRIGRGLVQKRSRQRAVEVTTGALFIALGARLVVDN